MSIISRHHTFSDIVDSSHVNGDNAEPVHKFVEVFRGRSIFSFTQLVV